VERLTCVLPDIETDAVLTVDDTADLVTDEVLTWQYYN